MIELLEPILATRMVRKLIDIVLYLSRRDRATLRQLCKDLGINYHMAMSYVEKLSERGLVRIYLDLANRVKVIEPTDRLRLVAAVLEMDVPENIRMFERGERKEKEQKATVN